MKVGLGRHSIFNHFYHNFAVPAPTSVMLSSSIPNPILPFGSNVTLTCAVELSPAVDIAVTVNTELTNPDGFATLSMISSFGRSNSGIYTCRAAITSTNAYISDSSTVSHSIRVTTGKINVRRNMSLSNIIFQVFILYWEVYKLLITVTLASKILANRQTALMVLCSASLTLSLAVVRIQDVGSGTYQMEH